MPKVAEQIAKELGLTETEREELLPSGRQRMFYNRLAWAKFHMSKAGLIDAPGQGLFTASDAGRALLARRPARIDVETLRTYPTYVKFLTKTIPSIGVADADEEAATSTSTPEEQIDAAYLVLHAALKADLLQRVLDNTPAFFERAIVDLLVAMGYGGSPEDASSQLRKGSDGGVDGVINEDRLGLDRIYVQAKRYAAENIVGRPAIQGFVGSLVGLGATKGVFVTTSGFSSQAAEFVRHLSQRVILIDGDGLCELMIEYGVGVRESRKVAIRRADDEYFEDS